MAATPDKYVFYLAGAHILQVLSPSRCKIWLPDYSTETTIEDWLDNERPPVGDTVEVNLDYTPDSPGPEVSAPRVHVAPRFWGNFRLTDLGADLPLGERISGQVALAEELWESLSPKPSPTGSNRDYQIKVIMRMTGGKATSAFLGFRAQVRGKSTENGIVTKLGFYSWIGDPLGEVPIDLTDPRLDQDLHDPDRLTATSDLHAEGAVYVSLDSIGKRDLAVLSGPKVPYGASNSSLSSAVHLKTGASPVIICGVGPDDWLEGARRRVQSTNIAGTEADLLELLKDTLSTGTPSSIILLSHSENTSHGNLLKFGNYTLRTGALPPVSPELRQLLHQKPLFLAGCRTAIGDAARATLQSLQDDFGVVAYGTARFLGHFDLDGTTGINGRRLEKLFIPASQAKDSQQLDAREEFEAIGLRPHKLSNSLESFVWGDFFIKSKTSGDNLMDILKGDPGFESGYYVYPGIMTEPEISVTDSGLTVALALNRELLRLTRLDSRDHHHEFNFYIEDEERRNRTFKLLDQIADAQRKPSVK